jgi:hypothetical protein
LNRILAAVPMAPPTSWYETFLHGGQYFLRKFPSRREQRPQSPSKPLKTGKIDTGRFRHLGMAIAMDSTYVENTA